VAPALSKHGFSYSWATRQERDGRSIVWIEVTCTLKHRLGHSESVTLGGPPDISGNKNPIQQVVSTVTYLERHTLKAITGVSEKGEDDDGQGGPEQRPAGGAQGADGEASARAWPRSPSGTARCPLGRSPRSAGTTSACGAPPVKPTRWPAVVKFRCSSLGKLMTEPKSKAEGPLSQGAKTYIRQLAAQEIFGVDFEISSKQIEKGIEVEPESLALLNRVRGLQLVKNSERRQDDFLTGECDMFDTPRRRGHDLKSSWSVATFPIVEADCIDKLYEWQMRGYMRLWDAHEWEVNYCLVNTPERLIGYEPPSMHIVDHIPECMRLTTWTVTRDREKEEAAVERLHHARRYYAEVIAEFDSTHRQGGPAPVLSPPPEDRPPTVRIPVSRGGVAQLAANPFA
jgi:hypothetical protein